MIKKIDIRLVIILLISITALGQKNIRKDTLVEDNREYFLKPVIVEEGESLWSLSEEHFGDGQQFTKFWTVSKTNGLTNNPNKIYPGMVLYKLAEKDPFEIDYDYFDKKFDSLKSELRVKSPITFKDFKFPFDWVWKLALTLAITLSLTFVLKIANQLTNIYYNNIYMRQTQSVFKQQLPYLIAFGILVFSSIIFLFFIDEESISTFEFSLLKMLLYFIFIIVIILIILSSVFYILNNKLEERTARKLKESNRLDNQTIEKFINFLIELKKSKSTLKSIDYWIYYMRIKNQKFIKCELEKYKEGNKANDLKDETKETKIKKIIDLLAINEENKIL